MTRLPLLTTLAFLSIAASGLAQDWRWLLKDTDHDLRTEHYARARKMSIKLINSMCDNLNRGDNAMYTLAVTVAYRAVAEAGMKRYDEADWYWHVARSLYPDITKRMDLKPYGEAGTWIAGRSEETIDAAGAPLSEVIRPTCVNRSEPKYPLGAVRSGVAEPITLRVMIDRDGIVRHPSLVSTTAAPTLVYAATEAIRKWQFEPATLDGKACPYEGELTVNFRAQQ